jgi:hypothetical protein
VPPDQFELGGALLLPVEMAQWLCQFGAILLLLFSNAKHKRLSGLQTSDVFVR